MDHTSTYTEGNLNGRSYRTAYDAGTARQESAPDGNMSFSNGVDVCSISQFKIIMGCDYDNGGQDAEFTVSVGWSTYLENNSPNAIPPTPVSITWPGPYNGSHASHGLALNGDLTNEDNKPITAVVDFDKQEISVTGQVVEYNSNGDKVEGPYAYVLTTPFNTFSDCSAGIDWSGQTYTDPGGIYNFVLAHVSTI